MQEMTVSPIQSATPQLDEVFSSVTDSYHLPNAVPTGQWRWSVYRSWSRCVYHEVDERSGCDVVSFVGVDVVLWRHTHSLLAATPGQMHGGESVSQIVMDAQRELVQVTFRLHVAYSSAPEVLF